LDIAVRIAAKSRASDRAGAGAERLHHPRTATRAHTGASAATRAHATQAESAATARTGPARAVTRQGLGAQAGSDAAGHQRPDAGPRRPRRRERAASTLAPDQH